MSRGLGPVLAGLLVVVLAVTTGASAARTPPAEPGPGRDLVVLLEHGARPDTVATDVGVDTGRIRGVFREAVTGFAATLTTEHVERLAADARVRTVEPDHRITGLSPPTGVRRIGAHEYGPAGIGGGTTIDVDVAIVDSGVDAAHPDLRVVGGVDCRSGSCATVDPVDPNGHGTHVAGTASALDDGVGVVGVAPGARVTSVRVLDEDGNGSLSAMLAGLDWLRANADRVEVANLSIGCECRSTALDEAVTAVTEAGMTLVTAAGNTATDAGGFSPANHPDTIAVAAMSDYDGERGARALAGCLPDLDDSFASYSNHGGVVDLVAPGSCIVSTWPGDRYARTSGTSMATPHVAGTAALHVATEGLPRTATRPDEVRRALLDEFSVASTDECGYTGSRSTAPMLHLTCPGIAGNTPPDLEVTAPPDGLTVSSGETVRLRASAEDAQDGALDERIRWNSSHDGQLGTGGSLDVTLTTPGEHTVSAVVTDSSGDDTRAQRGVTVTDGSGAVPDQTGEPPGIPEEPEPEPPPDDDEPPQLTLVAPVPDARLVADREALLVARATDASEGDLATSVRWHSDRAGELGEGGTVSVTLGAGEHRITATVTDGDGRRTERTSPVVVASAAELASRGIARACPPDRVPDRGFGDVSATSPHAAAVDCVVWWEVARGTGADRYGPDRVVSRGQMATFLAEAILRSGGSLPSDSGSPFDDVDGTTHESNVERLAAAGVVRGTGPRTFEPEAPVTRAQMASFLVQAYEHRAELPLPGIQERFDDVTGVHQATIHALAAAGVTGGVEADRYDPATPVRRDQMASFVARTLDLLVHRGLSTPPA